MKLKPSAIYLAICLTLVASLGLLVYAQTQSKPTKTKSANSYRLSGPYSHKNLSIFLIHGKDITKTNFLTLQEALAQKQVIVYETREVNELSIRNISNRDVYVQAGDIVKGGDQDRMISMDFIVPAKSKRIPIAAFCVEAGRWNRRGNEANESFGSSLNSASTKELKLAAKQEGSQSAVWNYVKVAQDKLSRNVGGRVNSSVSDSSLELAVENHKVKETSGTYINALSGILRQHHDVIGYVFAINGEVNSADVYGSSALFTKLWPKLLKATAVEAVAELTSETKSDSISADAVHDFLGTAEQPKPSEKSVTSRVQLVTREDARNIFFETRDRGQGNAWVHRNYIKK
jgi:hypothetical protein